MYFWLCVVLQATNCMIWGYAKNNRKFGSYPVYGNLEREDGDLNSMDLGFRHTRAKIGGTKNSNKI